MQPIAKHKRMQTELNMVLKEAAGAPAICSPFLKWAGRKTRILDTLRPLLPAKASTYIEPFVGSGAVFLNTSYQRNLLADSNGDLIGLYQELHERGQEFIDQSARLFSPENNREERYYEFREEFNRSQERARRAALFIYLNRHCFNGLCRYNASGEFNTPFGRYDKPYFPAAEMKVFAERLKGTQLRKQDFRVSLRHAGRGDVVYCDPPYVPLSATASFTSYATGGFGPAEQEELARLCVAAAKLGATVLISNHDTPETRKLYAQADKIVSLMVARMISCDGANRNKAKELIAVYEARS